MSDAAVSEPTTATSTGVTAQPTPAPADWRSFVTDDLKADPVVSKWSEKASEKDVPSLIKGYAHASHRLGSAINLPGKDAKPEDVSALRSKLYEAGVFEAPPSKPEEYGLTKQDTLPEGLRWSDELANKFATTLHKHGVPKSAVGELMPLYVEAITGASKALKTSMDEGLRALKGEFGDRYDELKEAASRMSQGIFKTPEEVEFFEATGLANHPGFLSILMRLAPLALSDSSYMANLPRKGGEMTGEDAKNELQKVMTDPTHPDYKLYKMGDPKTLAKYMENYKKAYGTEQVPIGQGISA